MAEHKLVKYDMSQEAIDKGYLQLRKETTDRIFEDFKQLDLEEQADLLIKRGANFAVEYEDTKKGKQVVGVNYEVAYACIKDMVATKITDNTTTGYKDITLKILDEAEEHGIGAMIEGINDACSGIKQLTCEGDNGTHGENTRNGLSAMRDMVKQAGANIMQVRNEYKKTRALVESIGTSHLEENEDGYLDMGNDGDEALRADTLMERGMDKKYEDANVLNTLQQTAEEPEAEPQDPTNALVVTEKEQFGVALTNVRDAVQAYAPSMKASVKGVEEAKMEFAQTAAECGLQKQREQVEETGMEINDDNVGLSGDIDSLIARADKEIETLHKEGKSVLYR